MNFGPTQEQILLLRTLARNDTHFVDFCGCSCCFGLCGAAESVPPSDSAINLLSIQPPPPHNSHAIARLSPTSSTYRWRMPSVFSQTPATSAC